MSVDAALGRQQARVSVEMAPRKKRSSASKKFIVAAA